MKTVVIGLDGATFDVIDPLLQDGKLPTPASFIREGVRAPLRSTTLPNSFPGWASCTTGTSEGMHGIFSPFIKNERDGEAVIKEVRQLLTELKSPHHIGPVSERVMRRDEAFVGRWSHRLLDPVMIPTLDCYVYNERLGGGNLIVPADSTTGTHARDGDFVAWGGASGVARRSLNSRACMTCAMPLPFTASSRGTAKAPTCRRAPRRTAR